MSKESPTTRLYKKMFAEQEKYRDWLLGQPPDEILNHTYEYTTREDILLSLEYNELETEQAKALLKSPTPLADIFKEYDRSESTHMDDILSAIEGRANAVVKADKERLKTEAR